MPIRSQRGVLISIVLVLIILAGVAFFMRGGTQGVNEQVPVKSYFHEEFGITFDYPDGYTISEYDLEGSAARKRHLITLVRNEDLPAPEGGEGPPAISIMIVQNDLDRLTTRQWVEGSADSNFKLSPDQGTAEVNVGGLPGIVYRWDGLYQGETTAVATPKWVYAFSVTFLNEDDRIVADYRAIINSVAYAR